MSLTLFWLFTALAYLVLWYKVYNSRLASLSGPVQLCHDMILAFYLVNRDSTSPSIVYINQAGTINSSKQYNFKWIPSLLMLLYLKAIIIYTIFFLTKNNDKK